MFLVQFRTTCRAVAWLLLAWVSVDLGFPALCALDQELRPLTAATASLEAPSSSDDGAPAPPVHIDDCFCCSHCVDVGSMVGLLPRAGVTARMAFPVDRAPFRAGYPLYHPPRA